MGKDQLVNIYTESRYAWLLLVCMEPSIRKGTTTAKGQTIKNKEENLQLLKAL